MYILYLQQLQKLSSTNELNLHIYSRGLKQANGTVRTAALFKMPHSFRKKQPENLLLSCQNDILAAG